MSSPFDFSSFLLTPPIPGSLHDQNAVAPQAAAPQNGQSSIVTGSMSSRDILVPNNGAAGPFSGQSMMSNGNQHVGMQQHQQQSPLHSPQQQFFHVNSTANNALPHSNLGERSLGNLGNDGNSNIFSSNLTGSTSNDASQLRTPQQYSAATPASPVFASPKSASRLQQSNANRTQPQQQQTQQIQQSQLSLQQQQQQVMQQQSQSQQQQQSHGDAMASTSMSAMQANVGPFTNNSSGNAVASGSKLSSFDERDYGLDPSAFSNVSFQMPSFLTASSNTAQFGNGGPAIVDPQA